MKQKVYMALLSLSVAAATAGASKPATVGTLNDGNASLPAVVAEGDTVAMGANATLTAYVLDGTAPFSLTWTNSRNEVVATAQLDNPDACLAEFAPTECGDYYVTLTDGAGLKAADTCRVVVTGSALTATMESLGLASESAWYGPDTKGEIVTGTYYDQQWAGSFANGSFMFSNNYSIDYPSTWSGFAYSNHTGTTFASLDDQFNSAVGHGYAQSENYVVAYSNGTITVLNSEEGDSISGFYITNNAYAVNSIVNGDAFAAKFTTGSFLKAIFTGTKADGNVTTLECYLADYRSENEADHYYLDTWQWMDLRAMGKVKKLEFFIDGSDKSYGYLNTPAYFCLDNLNGEREIATANICTESETDLNGYFSFENNGATVTFALADSLSEELKNKVEITADGKLTVGSGAPAYFSVVVSATQKGKTTFVRIPFNTTTAIGTTAAQGNATKAASYDLNGRNTATKVHGLNIIRMSDGTVRKVMVK